MILSVNSPPDFDLALSDLLWSGELPYPPRRIWTSTYVMRGRKTASNNESMNPDIPLIVVRNSGFVGKIRLQYRQHCSKSAEFIMRDNAHGVVCSRRYAYRGRLYPPARSAVPSVVRVCEEP